MCAYRRDCGTNSGHDSTVLVRRDDLVCDKGGEVYRGGHDEILLKQDSEDVRRLVPFTHSLESSRFLSDEEECAGTHEGALLVSNLEIWSFWPRAPENGSGVMVGDGIFSSGDMWKSSRASSAFWYVTCDCHHW